MCVIGNILGIPTAGTLVLLQFWLFILFGGIEGFSCVLCLQGSVFLNRSNKICRFLVEEVLLFAFCINGTQWRVFGISPGGYNATFVSQNIFVLYIDQPILTYRGSTSKVIKCTEKLKNLVTDVLTVMNVILRYSQTFGYSNPKNM